MKYIKNKPRQHDIDAKLKKINIVDIAIILVLIFMVLVSVEYFTDFSFFGKSGNKYTIEYTVKFENVDADMADSVKVGDVVRGVSGSGNMGEVILVNSTAQTVYVYNPETESLVARELPAAEGAGRAPRTLYVTVRAEAVYESGNGYTVDGHRVSVGSALGISLDGFWGNGKCTAIYGVK